MITPKSMTAWQTRSAALGAIAVALALAVLAARTGERESARAARPEAGGEKRWQAVASTSCRKPRSAGPPRQPDLTVTSRPPISSTSFFEAMATP